MQEKKKILIITQYSMPEWKRNMNAYQRIFYGADYADIALLLRRRQTASQELHERVRVYNAPVENRLLFLLYAVAFAGALRLRGCRILMTDPSGFAVVGFLSKYLFRMFWISDLWDRPRWRAGQHETGKRQRWADRLVFWIMRHADLYLLSLLPPAIKDINPPPERCVQFPNAIDMALVADSPPLRPSDDDTLHLSAGKSVFDETVGLDIIVKSAENLHARGCKFHMHVIGSLPDDAKEQIKSSVAHEHFTLYGITNSTRADIFKRIHVGLVPYRAFEDLSYIFPIKVLEHLSQGNPVIASDLPGLAATVKDGYNGLLVKPDDPVALADAIMKLQQDRALWQRLASNALVSIRQFDAREKNRKMFETIQARAP